MRVFRETLRALLSHWRQHPVQFFSVLTGLWLATSLLTGVQALNSQARDSYARASQLIGGEPQASLSAPERRDLPPAIVCRTAPRRLAGVAGAAGAGDAQGA